MKKVMFWVVLVVLAVSLLGWAVPVLADGEDNPKEAGQKVLAEKEKLLIEKRAAIEASILQAAADRVVTGGEIIALNKEVDNFISVKANADRYLKFYNLSTGIYLDKEMVTAVKNYYNSLGFFMRDHRGITKVYFVRLSGYDIAVGHPIFLMGSGQIVMIMASLVCLLLAVLIFTYAKENAKFCGIFFAFFLIVMVMILLLG